MKLHSKLTILVLLSFCISCNEEADISKSEPYIETWELLFQSQNKMDSAYFSQHIKLESSKRLTNEYGEYFKVDYTVSFEWFEAHVADSFMIFINGMPDTSLIMPKNQYLWYAAIDELIKSDLLNSHISIVGTWDKLAYADFDQVMEYIDLTIGECEREYSQMLVSQFELDSHGFLFKGNGDPCLFFSCYNSDVEKPCINSYWNLINTWSRKEGVECD